jgi:uncharacterized membrane protein YsdA (DUF1294 family)/cold shock CspA family protein
MRYQGQISEWNDARGFGFVRPRGGTGRVFVHISAFPPGSRRPSLAERVSYELGQDERGRPRATNVTYLFVRPPARERQRQSQGLIFAAVVAVTFLALIAMAVIAGSLHWAVIVFYVLASLVTYSAYAGDKRAAQTGGWRTKEGTLLLLGLAGGWPGGLIAQHRFRHKTKKLSFQVAYWLTVGLNCVGSLSLPQKIMLS